MSWELVAEQEECAGPEIMFGYSFGIKSVESCARTCNGLASMFGFGTNDFGDTRCDNDGNCKCTCETVAASDGTCTQSSQLGYRLYKYTNWPEEAKDKSCANNRKTFADVYTLLECQQFCEAEINCVGIAYSLQRTWCFVCKDDHISDAANGYGFYRRPGIDNSLTLFACYYSS